MYYAFLNTVAKAQKMFIQKAHMHTNTLDHTHVCIRTITHQHKNTHTQVEFRWFSQGCKQEKELGVEVVDLQRILGEGIREREEDE